MDQYNKEELNRKELLINEVFSGSEYRIFKEFCEEKEISQIKSINGEIIDKFSKIKGVGQIRLKQVIDKLIELDIDLDWSENNILFNIDKLKIKEEDNLKLLEIDSIFSHSKFRILREYCSDRNIITLYDMNNKDIYEFKEVKGIGEKRYQDFIKRLKEATKINGVKDIQEIAKIALDNLNPKESVTIIARFIEDLSLEETAEILEIGLDGTKKIEDKALENIQNTLNTYNGIRSLKLMTKSLEKFSLKDLGKSKNDKSILITNLIKKDELEGLSYIKSTDTVYFDILVEEIA